MIHAIGRELKDIREDEGTEILKLIEKIVLGLTQDQVAMELSWRLEKSISQSTVSRFEVDSHMKSSQSLFLQMEKFTKVSNGLEELAIAATAVIEKLWQKRQNEFATVRVHFIS